MVEVNYDIKECKVYILNMDLVVFRCERNQNRYLYVLYLINRTTCSMLRSV